jgi:hypothetical protein
MPLKSFVSALELGEIGLVPDISFVQPPVNAAGKKANTTFF